MNKYPKIYSPYERHTEGPLRNKLDRTRWTCEEFKLLADVPWTWTEKVDGTNIRVGWDGHAVEFGGRTDNAQIPAPLVQELRLLFPEELFEQTFQDKPVTLYGEGYGPKIQKVGHLYADKPSFALFDVQGESRIWFNREAVHAVAETMGLNVAPQLPDYTLQDAMDVVTEGFYSYFAGEGNPSFCAEGVVGTAPLGLLNRQGQRIQVKVKHVDFFQAA